MLLFIPSLGPHQHVFSIHIEWKLQFPYQCVLCWIQNVSGRFAIQMKSRQGQISDVSCNCVLKCLQSNLRAGISLESCIVSVPWGQQRGWDVTRAKQIKATHKGQRGKAGQMPNRQWMCFTPSDTVYRAINSMYFLSLWFSHSFSLSFFQNPRQRTQEQYWVTL